MKLAADTINGIYEIKENEVGEDIGERMFVLSLDDLGDDEIITATVSKKCYNILQKKYGVN
jgi:hypothetical protein